MATPRRAGRKWRFRLNDASTLEVSTPPPATEKQVRRRGRWTLIVGTLVAALMVSAVAGAAVWTDQQDYSPGSVVTISGDNSNDAGYLAGETVAVDVSGPNGYEASCEAVADENGAWSCQITLWDSELAVGEYTYTATGQESRVTESGTFTDNIDVSITAPAENSGTWYKTVSGGFDVTVSGKYTCNTSGLAANNCTSASVTVTIHPTNNTNNTVSATVQAALVTPTLAAGTNADWSVTFEFRTAPGAGQFSIPADNTYELKAVLSIQTGGGTNSSTSVNDDAFGVDNTMPMSSISTLDPEDTTCTAPSTLCVTATGSATDPGAAKTFSGFSNAGASPNMKTVHVEIREGSASGTPVAGSYRNLTLADLGSTAQTGTWSYEFPLPGNTPLSGTHCLVSWATDVASNAQDPVTSECFGSSGFTISGTKYKDLAADGSVVGDPGQMGWDIRVYADSNGDGVLSYTEYTAGTVATATSGADGTYTTSPALSDGKYIVCEDATEAALSTGGVWVQSFPSNTKCDVAGALAPAGHAVTIGTANVTGIDFGNWEMFFVGFEPGVDADDLNRAKAGQGVSFRFRAYINSPTGDQFTDATLGVLGWQLNSYKYVDGCLESAGSDEVPPADDAGQSGFRYDTTDLKYVYVWKTLKTWAKSCRTFEFKYRKVLIEDADFYFNK